MNLFGFRNKESDYYEYDYDKDYMDDRMASLDDDVTVAEEKLNRSIKRKEQAKDMAINDRVKAETEGLRAENKRLKIILKKIFRKAGRPAFCATRLYFALFVARGLRDYLIIFLSAVICFFAIPFTFIKISQGTVVGKVFLYIGIVVFFAALYYLVYRFTNPRGMWETICKGGPILNKISKNKQEIKRITRGIRQDKDESHYDLKEFDKEITRNQGLYDVALARKNDFIRKKTGVPNNGKNDEDYYDDDYYEREEPEVRFREFDEYEEEYYREERSGRKKR